MSSHFGKLVRDVRDDKMTDASTCVKQPIMASTYRYIYGSSYC